MRIITPLIVLCLFAGLFSCKPTLSVDCENALLPPNPVPLAKFRLLSATGNEDLIANNTVNFDSLVAMQPCNMRDTLGKVITSNGSGGYIFNFNDLRQPAIGENAECYRILLKWSDTDTDEVEFVLTGEFMECGTIYYIDRVLYNGKQVANTGGTYILRK